MNNYLKQLVIILGLLLPSMAFSQTPKKLDVQAKQMIGKTDKESMKLNTLKSWDAVKYCAKKAGIINQQESNSLSAKSMVTTGDKPVSTITAIPKGSVIGFFKGANMTHCMVSMGNGKAIGVNNKTSIGIGVDKKWEEISLQQFKYDKRTESFVNGTKKFKIFYRSADKLTAPSTGAATKPGEVNQNRAKEENDELSSYNWSKKQKKNPKDEFQKHKSDFPEFLNWKQYATKVADIKKKIKTHPPNLRVEKYNEVFVYDVADKYFLILDEEKLPVTMYKLPSEKEFQKFIESRINWDSKKGKRKSILNLKQEFEEHKDEFPQFKSWREYGYYAQQMVATAKGNSKIITRRVGQDMVYYNREREEVIVTNAQGEVYTFFKPPNNALQFFDDIVYDASLHGQYDKLLSLDDNAILPSDKKKEDGEEKRGAPKVKKSQWSQLGGTTYSNQYTKHKKSYPNLNSADEYKDYVFDVMSAVVDANGEFRLQPGIKVKRYGKLSYLYDPVGRDVITLDEKLEPITMEKLKGPNAFETFYDNLIGWVDYEEEYEGNGSGGYRIKEKKVGKINYIKKKFDFFKDQFEFTSWDEYASYGETLLYDATVKKKRTDKIHTQRVEGKLNYFNEDEGVYIVADRKNRLISLSKPKEGIEVYNYFTGKSGTNPDFNPSSEFGIRLMFEEQSADNEDKEYTLPPGDNGGEYTLPPGDNGGDSEYMSPPPPEQYGDEDSEDSEDGKQKADDDEGEDNYEVVDMDLDEDSEESVNEKEKADDYETINPLQNFDESLNLWEHDWAMIGSFPSSRVFERSYNENKRFFRKGSQIVSEEEYALLAHNFYHTDFKGKEMKTRNNGNILIYYESGNMLGEFDPSGLPLYITRPKDRRKAFELKR